MSKISHAAGKSEPYSSVTIIEKLEIISSSAHASCFPDPKSSDIHVGVSTSNPEFAVGGQGVRVYEGKI